MQVRWAKVSNCRVVANWERVDGARVSIRNEASPTQLELILLNALERG